MISLYILIHVLLLLPLNVMVWFLTLSVLIVTDFVVIRDVIQTLDSRLSETHIMRSIRLLNIFHYQPRGFEIVVRAFVDVLAP